MGMVEMAKTHMMKLKSSRHEQFAFCYVLNGSDAQEKDQLFTVEVNLYNVQNSTNEYGATRPNYYLSYNRNVVTTKDYSMAKEIFTAMTVDVMKRAEIGDYL